MSRAQRNTNLAAVILPLVAFVVAIVLLWNSWVGWSDLVLMGVLYVLTGLGITVGFHRMLTHRSFQTSKAVERTFAVLGSLAVQGPVIQWVSDHRKHHAHTDEEGDPHSPHAGFAGGGVKGTLRGLFHAHVGWILTEEGGANRAKYAKDLVEDRGMKRISDNFHWLVVVSLLLPAALGFAIAGGDWKGAVTGLLWGGFVRIFLLHHVTWSINSICHFFGTRRFAVDDHSTNVFWLALPSFGEAWHHNHHTFPRSAQHGLARWERLMDPSAGLIWAMEKLGLVWNVVRITPERQAEKLATASRKTPASVG
ncbi:MAG TPA: acyl-CoA desaturase [Baekduia sp.]|uniref:acyl-CoA desaturase n=1 Tax=Baekduia sp. TaxID=2600305 RepID=UPI002D787A7E|nr:acyl-CoA desaturase [Baekduia sp.]HET6509531.1 acyl-CoA desaturase [Baekduia sp.]